MLPATTPSRPGPGRWRLTAAWTAAILILFRADAASAAGIVTVMLDRAQMMSLPVGTETVILGNPIVADVTTLRQTGQIILTGKGYGETNILFVDGHGTLLEEAHVQVRQAPSTVVVQRGPDRESFSCHPRCEPAIVLGDASTFLQNAVKDVQLRNSLETGAAQAGAGR